MRTQKYSTLDEVLIDIAKFNLLLGFPDEKSDTITYCNVPEVTEVLDDNGNIVDSYYELIITSELDLLLNPDIIE